MSALCLVRIALDRPALTAFAVSRRLSDDDLGYAIHLALRLRFGEAAPQPFRLEEPPGRAPFLIGYTPDPAALEAAQALPPTDPALEAVFSAPPECRAMPASWTQGARFRFKVRVRPLVRYGGRIRAARARAGKTMLPAAGEVDAFIAACNRAEPGTPVDRETVYREWLASRMSPAAVIEDLSLDQMRRIDTRRALHVPADAGKAAPRTRLTQSPEALFSGTLAIADVPAFVHVLARGVGRHTAFGFGMLTLAPPAPAGRG